MQESRWGLMGGLTARADGAGSHKRGHRRSWRATRTVVAPSSKCGGPRGDRRGGRRVPIGERQISQLEERIAARLGNHLGPGDPGVHRGLPAPPASALPQQHMLGGEQSVAQPPLPQGQTDVTRLDVPRARAVRQGEIEPPQEESPASLPSVQSFSGAQVREVLVVSPYQEGLSGPLQPISPLLKSQHHRQQFGVRRCEKKAQG